MIDVSSMRDVVVVLWDELLSWLVGKAIEA